jgi:hypothetical protein
MMGSIGQDSLGCRHVSTRRALATSGHGVRSVGWLVHSMRILWSLLVVALAALLFTSAASAQPVDVTKTNPLKVYMHYMPWFDTPAVLGGSNWGYHWKMQNKNPNIVDATGKRQIASHYYPKIGAYQSNDADVIEYHMLLMKYAGVDGVMIDWYGVQGTNGDIGRLLTNSNAVVDRIGNYGLDFSVVLEDRFSANIGQAKANVAYLKNNYFNRPEYIRINSGQDPLMGVFGPITFQQESQWTQILAEAGEDVDFMTLWYEKNDAGINADGEYAWIYEDGAQNNHLTHQSNFYRFRAPTLNTAGGVAYPGFNDYYVQGGVGDIIPFDIPHNGGQTLDDVLDIVSQNTNRMDFLQLATFNDFGEGTMFEPTIETGYDYLVRMQEFTGVPYGQTELELIYRLYMARKKYAGSAPTDALLDQVSTLLSQLEVEDATNLLNSAAPAGDYNADGNVDDADFTVWKNAFGSATISYGSGADGNFDGVIDAADYTVWRNNYGAVGAGGGSYVNVVPEPSSMLLSILAAAATCGHLKSLRIRCKSDSPNSGG